MPKPDDKDILRIIDVNLNRLCEGLRVCEDIVRFILNNAYFTKALKSVRHKVQRVISSSKIRKIPLCVSRDVKLDVGTKYDRLEERKSWESIFFANMQRSKESVRVLEEFFKLFDKKTAESFKGLRFEIYDFEKKVIESSQALSDNKCCSRPKAAAGKYK
ncbi:MAG: thiamine-phosphate pyrophosphorylase [Candidatus Omnitrophota bacterium]